MAITDRTRKVLWGRSGNRCAICKKELVVDSTPHDDESVVGDECHIISSRPEGPRYDPTYPAEHLDAYQNLILLCRIHHKQVDDQTATFSAAILRQMKSNHEVWVSERLADPDRPKPVRIRRIKQNIPSFLSRLTTGKDLLDLVSYAMGYSFDHDELKSQQEVDLVGAFLQTVQDWGEISGDMEAGDRVQTTYGLTASLRELEENGFLAFGAREAQLLEGGIQAVPSSWPIAILRILRRDNIEILSMTADKTTDEKPNQTVQRTGASRSAQETKMTSSAAGSRR
ncbi:MAG TPA: HNH endonuclease signature motif containing protein [Verrucomicrobiales bacterium]|nr:HNH endonuclease signature motif containing protein [Verrucomicrobiales bacterium]